jgi:sugar/nucleoside kinase (ribokinase family)
VPEPAEPPSFVIVGHVTLDVTPGGLLPGGTVTYAGRMARNLGERVGVVTSAAERFDFASVLPGVQVANRPADQTSTFENRYPGGRREQYVRAVAEPLDAGAVPTSWLGARTLLLAPLTNEVLGGVEELFPKGLRAATPQGWLRRWGADGRVRLEGWSTLVDRLARLDAVVLSEEDVQRDEATIDLLRRNLPLLVVTQGPRGARLFVRGAEKHFPPFPTVEVDPTGAGDVFAGAFLVELSRTGDPERACVFANCAASFSVEAPGAEGVPTREQIAARLGAAERG